MKISFENVALWSSRYKRGIDNQHDRHGCGSKSTLVFLLCLWERHFRALISVWLSYQAVLNFSHFSNKN